MRNKGLRQYRFAYLLTYLLTYQSQQNIRVIGCLHDRANIEQTSSKRRAKCLAAAAS